jgi:hypothetical protein
VLTLLLLGQTNVCTTSLGCTARGLRFSPLLAYLGEGEEAIFIDAQPRNGQSQDMEQTRKTYLEGAGTLGDIMSDGSRILRESGDQCEAGLVTRDGGTLASRFGIDSRFDRMALTANGNLQRLFSSYYDAPVHVVVDSCEQRTQEMWHRTVHLTVFDQVSWTTAASVISFHTDNSTTNSRDL